MQEGKLDAHIDEGGTNFSAGQRQLICLGVSLCFPFLPQRIERRLNMRELSSARCCGDRRFSSSTRQLRPSMWRATATSRPSSAASLRRAPCESFNVIASSCLLTLIFPPALLLRTASTRVSPDRFLSQRNLYELIRLLWHDSHGLRQDPGHERRQRGRV